MANRLLMLGLDSIDWKLVDEWSSAGRLPTLTSLLSESSKLMFLASNRALPGSVWTDIGTGASAAHHGYIHEEQVALESYRSEHISSNRVSVAPFYKTLSGAGIRCAVVDFPVDYPIDDFNGVQVIDWGTEFKLWKFETRPASFAAKLQTRYGKHPLTDYGITRTGLGDLAALKDKLIGGVHLKQRFLTDLLDRREHEFVFFNFAELHKAGHFFWRFHDRGHPDYTEAEPRLRHSLRECYEAVDRAVGEALRHLDADDDLIVITDRGMYADHRGDHLVDDLLLKLELAVPRGSANVTSGARKRRMRLPTGPRAARLYHAVGSALPGAVRDALLPLHRAAKGEPPPLNWSSTRVFRLPSVGNSYLRINLAGREAGGIVAAGREYEQLLAEIAERFRGLINRRTGKPAVEGVYFPAREFPGPRSVELPDVAILWDSSAPIEVIESPEIGRVAGTSRSRRSGNHRPDGFALFRGPSFAYAAPREGDPREIAPAVLKRFGVPPPPHYEMAAPSGI
jgi:predicted AlkP superfamily phosphohydrolase/phosphomutase